MKLWRFIRKASVCDSGIFALLTLVFFIACGMMSIFILWGIAQSTAIYNLAYYTTQTAATAAAGAVCLPADYGTSDDAAGSPCDSGQIIIECSVKDAPDSTKANAFQCLEGLPLELAKKSLNASLSPQTPGRFGLLSAYDPNVDPADLILSIDSLFVYNIPSDAGAEARKNGCSEGGALDDGGVVNEPDDGSSLEPSNNLACWAVRENGIQGFPWQYETGLVLRTVAEVDFPAFCQAGDAFCVKLNLPSAGAARAVQKVGPANYELYNCYGYERDFEDALGVPSGNCEYDTLAF